MTCTATDTDDTPSTVSASFTVTVTVTDTDLALGTVPTSITASTSNPAGTAVTYTAPTASDEDGPVPVVCTPASGSTFPIGTTTVTCTATDTDDTPSTVSTSFTVTVNDPPPAPSGTASLDQLEAAVKAANLGHGVVEKVERADRALHAGNVRAACSALDGLVDELSGRLHQPKLKARVAPLIVNAQQIESALGCKKDHHSDGSGTGGHRGFESLFAFAAMGELARRRQRNRA